MDESEDTMSSDDSKNVNNLPSAKKPKKRSLVERELETSLTARVTSPVTNGDASCTSRYGRTRRLKTDADFCEGDKAITKALKSPSFDKSPIKIQSPVYRMHASNSPSRTEPPKMIATDTKLENQMEHIYNANVSLSRFGNEEKNLSLSPVKKYPKVYVRKDLIQSKEKEETVSLRKNIFSPVKSPRPTNSHLSNVLERSSEKYALNGNVKQNGYLDTSSVVKTLDFDGKKKKKDSKDAKILSKSELFEMEAKCAYQVGDLAWARMGTYPFWPCIVTREPGSEMFIRKKLCGRVEHDIIHVTFFGDNGRRSWVMDTMLRKFLGLQEFEDTREQFTPEDKKKDIRLYAAFLISEKKIPLWNTSVEEAETLLKEPKRLRIDLLNDLLEKSRVSKVIPKQQTQQKARSETDVPLSESLYDTLFSEDDAKPDDSKRSRNKTRNKSLDVSEVVTACLDNMAAKTGMIKIQKQSHMDRWLQKAKSKTPEKLKVTATLDKIEKESKDKKDKIKLKEKESKAVDSKKKKIAEDTPIQTKKPYHFRRSVNESQNLLSYHNEHDYSIKDVEKMEKCYVKLDRNDTFLEPKKVKKIAASQESDLCVTIKVETLSDRSEDENCNNNGVNVDYDENNKTVSDKYVINTNIEVDNDQIIIDITSSDIELESPTQANDDVPESTKPDTKGESILNTNEAIKHIDSQINTNKLDDNILGITEANDTINIELTTEIMDKGNTCNQEDIVFQNTQETIILMADSASIEQDVSNQEKSCVSDEVDLYNAENDLISEGDDKAHKYSDDTARPEVNDTIYHNNLTLDTEEGHSESNSGIDKNANPAQINPSEYVIEHNTSDHDDLGSNGVTSTDNDKVTDIIPVEKDIENFNSGIDENEDPAHINSVEYVIKHITSDDKDLANNGVTSKYNDKVSDKISMGEHIDILKNVQSESDVEGTESLFNNVDIEEAIKPFEKETEDEDNKITIPDNEVSTSKANEAIVQGQIDKNALDIQSENSEETRKQISASNDVDIDSGDYDLQGKMSDIESISSMEHEDALLADEKGPNQDNPPESMLTAPVKTTYVSVSSAKHGETELLSNVSSISDMDSVTDIVSVPKDLIEENFPQIKSVSSLESIENASISSEDDVSVNNGLIKLVSRTQCSNIAGLTIACSQKEIIASNGNETSAIVENGFHDALPNLKLDNFLDSETESINSELDDIALSQLKIRSSQGNSKVKSKEPKNKLIHTNIDPEIDATEIKLPKIVKVETENTEVSMTSVFVDMTSENNTMRKSRLSLRRDLQTGRGNHESIKDDSLQIINIKDTELDAISTKSEGSTASTKRRRKEKAENTDNIKDPEFLRYLELRQDVLIEEHPELTIEEITAYLYKTWIYENSMKSEQKKSDDIEQSNLVKGQEPTKPVKHRKKNCIINIDKVLGKELKKDTNEVTKNNPPSGQSGNKPKRKTSVPYYNEDYSDIEDEIKMFEIFNNKSKEKLPQTESPLQVAEIKADKEPKTETQLTKIKSPATETVELVEYDEVEAYFEELTKPKPSIFKGLAREKVCEICERTNNLLKCKGCHGMFHVDCVKKQKEIVEVPMPTKGRKKKKKPRGRKPKISTDSNGVDSESQSDEKSQDLSGDLNLSIEDIESDRIVTDAELFETKFATKMSELLEKAEKIDYDSYSTDDELDWKGVKAGKCKIVDIRLKPRSKPIELDFKCHNCLKYDQPVCFVCKSAVSPKAQNVQKQKCQIAHCHKYYHLECLEQWPQTQFNSGEPSKNNKKINEFFEAMSCPRHVCHTCVSDDPRGCKTRFSGDKLARCVRCPATYHSFTKCLPAGSQILTASQIICPRHYQHRPGKVPCHVNTGWCFICALGGSLICCEYCPTSFHAECLNIKPPEGGYMCEDCETGRLPLYGEIVWVKLGHYRWWPGIILHPFEIPENIMAVKHSLGEFVVRFFGQYDHYWVNRGRVFPFQEGDSGKVSGQKSKIDEAFTVAMEHATRAFSILQSVEANEEESLDIASSLLPPHYVKLKVNKPCGSLCGRRIDIEESSLTQCECNPDEEEPCGLYSHCLNRMLLTECGPTCRAGDRCNNRAFEKRQYPKLVPYRTPHRGWGLKTLEDIKAGQFVIEYVGELIDEEEFQRRMRRMHEIRDENFYFLTLDKERMIDAGPKGNSARFMNHCCEPNCETQKWTVLGDVRVGLFAINDIPANSEVTFNYNLECAGIEKKRCLCGAKRCSGYIGAKPKQDEPQSKKNKFAAKRTYKKRKNVEESPSTSKVKPKRPVGRPAKPRELTEIEKDLLIIKNATNGISSDSECSRLSSLEGEAKALKRKRVSFSEDNDSSSSPSVKRLKVDERTVGD